MEGVPAAKVEYEPLAATQTSMAFFDRILEPANNLTRSNGEIRQCYEEKCSGFYIDDNILAVSYWLEDKKTKQKTARIIHFFFLIHRCYWLKNTIFITCILKAREMSFYSTFLNTYTSVVNGANVISISNHIYKLQKIFIRNLWGKLYFYQFIHLCSIFLIYDCYISSSVERIEGSSDIRIRSVVFKVNAYQEDGEPLCPTEPEHVQNFVYLIVDPFKRQLSVLMNYYGGYLEWILKLHLNILLFFYQ